MKWLGRAAEHGDRGAGHLLREHIQRAAQSNGPDDLELLRVAAEGGSGEAQWVLGEKYFSGSGILRDCRQAGKWLGRAVARDAPGARRLLREHIQRAAEDSRPADLELLQGAAEGGFGEAQLVLGEKYLLGCGVGRDCREAGKWLGRASKRGERGAGQLLREHLRLTAEDSRFENLELLRGAAEGDFGEAQRVLGEKYLLGSAVERDCQKAVKWLSLAAKRDEPGAEESLRKQIRLAARHRRPYDLELLQAAAEQGMGEAMKVLGKKYLSSSWINRDCRRAVRWLRRATLRHEPGARQLFGHHLRHAASHSSPSDLEFLHVAAEEGFGEAERVLGEKYLSGSGVERDYRQAGRWLGRAAERYELSAWKLVSRRLQQPTQQSCPDDLEFLQGAAQGGFGRAQFVLGQRYLLGSGVNRDHRQAARWLTRAAILKAPGAKELLKQQLIDAARTGSPTDSEFLRVAAKEGFGQAQVMLGEMYLVGRGVERDYGAAERWFRRAAEQGRADALYRLGKMRLNAHGIRRHRQGALKLITTAAERGCSDALHHLLMMHRDEVDKKDFVLDPVLALRWLGIRQHDLGGRSRRSLRKKTK